VRLQKSKKKTTVVGGLSYSDPASNVSFSSTKVTTLTFNGNQAHIAGTGKVGKKKVSFSVDVTDNGFPGTLDLFSISLSDGYAASGNLATGDISIR